MNEVRKDDNAEGGEVLNDMKVEMLKIEKLVPYNKNPRNISDDAVEAVVKSIKEFGFNQAIMVDQNFRICVGHTRYLAAKELNMKTVPVFRREMSEEAFTAYNIADNKTGEFTSWNKKLLIANWEKLEGWEDLKSATGLQAWEVDTPESGKDKRPKPKPNECDENVICLELIYEKETEKEIRKICQEIDGEAQIEDTILYCVREAGDKHGARKKDRGA